jgi:hypothetical protein
MVTTGSQKITVWGPGGTLLGMLRVKNYKENNIFYHTYQLQEETAYRIVIKRPHHSTENKGIREELFELGHNARNTINTQHRITK